MASITVQCPRCGGAGGWVGWPGFTCFLCRGECTRTYASERIAKRERERYQGPDACLDTCQHCNETKESKWFYMKGTELWCKDCFNAFRAKQGGN